MLKVNLQLFGEGDTLDGVVDRPTSETPNYEIINDDETETQDDAIYDDIEDDYEEDYEEDEINDDTEDDSEELEVAAQQDSKGKQSKQENAQFKKMRLKAEQEARNKIEQELAETKKEIEAQRMALQQQLSEKKIIDEYLHPSKVYDYADEHGLTEDAAKKILTYEANKVIDEHKNQVTERFNKIQEQKRELQKSKYFKLLEAEVDEVLRQQPEQDFKSVYNYLVGDRIDTLEKQLSSNVEKRTIANMHDKARRRNLGGSQGSTNPSLGMSDFGREFAEFLGVDPREAAKVVKERKKNRR